MKKITGYLICLLLAVQANGQTNYMNESKTQKDRRMQWWREARFGLFIHWGLYAIPAGAWGDRTDYGEWIRHSARIPLQEYDQLVKQFNPTQFDAESWVQMAKDAGMKYIVITTKHHDGFCLWDSKATDFDVMSTPFHQDIIKSLADACRKIGGVKLCFYHSIMDWHHPDYNVRRPWETDRPTDTTDRKRYIAYLKAELRELLTNYGDIGVLWFDGEWESFWQHEDGVDLYNYVRSLQPGIIINNRVDKGRDGMAGMSGAGFAGDFGTPEQEIPSTGLPGVDWESCMTMNDNWGYNKADKNFKSAAELIRNLVDIVSKGGNFLLNIGPRADGTFPPESVERLKAIAGWMRVNKASIYGTTASNFDAVPWGRITQKKSGDKTLLYLHVFHWPDNGQLQLNGLGNSVTRVYGLAGGQQLEFTEKDNTVTIQVPPVAADIINTVLVMEIKGPVVVYNQPVIHAFSSSFMGSMPVSIDLPGGSGGLTIRYTTDGREPDYLSPIYNRKITLTRSCVLKVKVFAGKKAVSTTAATFTKVTPPAVPPLTLHRNGLVQSYFKGSWNSLPSFATMEPQLKTVVATPGLGSFTGKEEFGLTFDGWIKLPAGVYHFYLVSDDGSALYIDGQKAVDNDGLHGAVEKMGTVALGGGFHALHLGYFNKTGGSELGLWIESPTLKKQPVTPAMLFCENQ